LLWSFQLTLCLQDPHRDRERPSLPEALQQKLVMPFAILKDLNGLIMEGPCSESTEKELRAAHKMPDPSPVECLETAAALQDKGDEMSEDKQYTLSVQTYIQALEAMHLFCERDCLFDVSYGGYGVETLDGGRFDGKRADLTHDQPYSQLSWNILRAYLKLEDLEHAFMWAALCPVKYANVIEFIEDGWPTPIADHEKAACCCCVALACKGLGKSSYETEKILLEGMKYIPNERTSGEE